MSSENITQIKKAYQGDAPPTGPRPVDMKYSATVQRFFEKVGYVPANDLPENTESRGNGGIANAEGDWY